MGARIFLSSLFQGSFPGNLHLVLVLRPSTFLQRTLSEVFFKVNKDDFKMKVHILGFFLLLLLLLFFLGLKKIYHVSVVATVISPQQGMSSHRSYFRSIFRITRLFCLKSQSRLFRK